MIHTSEKKLVFPRDGKETDGLVEVPVRRSKTLPIHTGEELQKVIPLSEQEETELAEIGERLEERGFLTDVEKARAKELLKKPRTSLPTKATILPRAIRALTGLSSE